MKYHFNPDHAITSSSDVYISDWARFTFSLDGEIQDSLKVRSVTVLGDKSHKGGSGEVELIDGTAIVGNIQIIYARQETCQPCISKMRHFKFNTDPRSYFCKMADKALLHTDAQLRRIFNERNSR